MRTAFLRVLWTKHIDSASRAIALIASSSAVPSIAISYIMSLNAPPTRRSKCPRATVFIDLSWISSAMASFAYWVMRQDAAPATNYASGGGPPSVPPLSGGSSIVKLKRPEEAWKRRCSTSSTSTLCVPIFASARVRRSSSSPFTIVVRSGYVFKDTMRSYGEH